MQYRVKKVIGKCGDSDLFVPQRKYPFIPIWFNFYMTLNYKSYKMWFSTEFLVEKWLRMTLSSKK